MFEGKMNASLFIEIATAAWTDTVQPRRDVKSTNKS